MVAAQRIQACWRGHVARRMFAPSWAKHQEAKAQQQAAVAIQAVRPVMVVVDGGRGGFMMLGMRNTLDGLCLDSVPL